MAQEWSLSPQAAPAKARGKGLVTSGIVLLILGLIAVVGGVAGFAVSAASLVTEFGSPQNTPATITRTLDGGTTYAVYEAATGGTGTTADPLIGNVLPSDITVKGAAGDVAVKDVGSTTQTYDVNGKRYGAVATFDPPTSGQYTIEVQTEDAIVVVAPSFTSFGKAAIWILLVLLGVVLGLIGLILLIVGLVKRSRSKKELAMASGGYAATSYAAPGQVQQPYSSQPYATGPGVEQPLTPEPVAQPFLEQPGAAEAPVVATTPAPAAPQPVAPVAPQAALPPAGWYADPQRPGGQRYWDGATWTQHTA
jgi:hypothetical protein